MSFESQESGYGNNYQRCAEIESILQQGIPLEERHRREADFAIRSANLKFEEDDKVLDLACGSGGHARRIAEKCNVHVDARDIEENLLEIWRRELEDSTEEVRDRIMFALGDMGNVLDSVPKGARYKLITVLGSSFMFLGTKEAHQKALDDYFSLLEPGGKIVFQFRQSKDDASLRLRKEDRIQCHPETATGQHGRFGEFAEPNEDVYVLYDTEKHDGLYYYKVPVAHTDDLTYFENEGPEEGLPPGWYDSDGIRREAFGRAYFDSSGRENKVGEIQLIDYMTLHGYHNGMKPMLERSGFSNVHLEEEPLSADGSFMQYAIVAEKI